MIKRVILLTILLYVFPINALSDVKLYYFTKMIKDNSYVGVKDENGKVIVPAQMWNIRGYKNGDIVEDNLLSFYSCPDNIKKEKQSFGCVFDRKGKYLYQSFAYDNGPDYRVEGLQRVVKDGKVGFANRNGEIIITPKYDFASPFHYGYAQVCQGCYVQKVDEGHSTVQGGKWDIINKKAEIILPLKTKNHKNDVEILGKYYPYPFSYSKKEKKILDFFYAKMRLLADLRYVNFYHKLNKDEKVVYFEIVERPSKNFPFYVVDSYNYKRRHYSLDNSFLVSQDGKQFFYSGYGEEKIPFDKWLKKEIKSAIEFQKSKTDNPNKFEYNKVK